jgi:alcohol dehydrogenase
MLLKAVMSDKVQPKQLITHHFALKDVMQAYNTFGNAMKERALKVIITNDQESVGLVEFLIRS